MMLLCHCHLNDMSTISDHLHDASATLTASLFIVTSESSPPLTQLSLSHTFTSPLLHKNRMLFFHIHREIKSEPVNSHFTIIFFSLPSLEVFDTLCPVMNTFPFLQRTPLHAPLHGPLTCFRFSLAKWPVSWGTVLMLHKWLALRSSSTSSPHLTSQLMGWTHDRLIQSKLQRQCFTICTLWCDIRSECISEAERLRERKKITLASYDWFA